jgi:GNAT superfamily N-acetyltransferase
LDTGHTLRPGRSVADVSVELHVTDADEPGLLELFEGIVVRGEGFPQLPPLRRDEYDAMWAKATVVVAARHDGALAGAYYLKPNGPGLAAHIANAGYAVDPVHRGLGIGRLLVEDSIVRAPALGFDAIQFNFVFERNPARALYEALGWEIVGRVPRALPDQDALIYWRAV